ncbi:MAG: hypothetical protein R2748_03050 [Bryobacterales bacterium]
MSNQNGVLPNPAVGGTGQTVDLLGQNWAFNLSSAFKPTLFNELRVGYTYFPTTFDIPIKENLNKEFGIKGAFGDTLNDGKDNGFALFGPAGFTQVGPRGFWPNFNDLKNLMVADNISLMVKWQAHASRSARRACAGRTSSASRLRGSVAGNFNFSGVSTPRRAAG